VQIAERVERGLLGQKPEEIAKPGTVTAQEVKRVERGLDGLGGPVIVRDGG
jgi:hypothetical protein